MDNATGRQARWQIWWITGIATFVVVVAAVGVGAAQLTSTASHRRSIVAAGRGTTTSFARTSGRRPGLMVNRDPHQRYEVTAYVGSDATHGPEMCFFLLTSLPPQCRGIRLANFDWAQVPATAKQQLRDVIWSTSLRLTGTFDGTTFTMTVPPQVAATPAPIDGSVQVDLTSPCPTPADGWKASDSTKVSLTDFDALQSYVNRQPDLAAYWFSPPGDPTQAVINVAFTGNVARHEAEIRAVWGGPVCVIERQPSKAAMEEFQRQLTSPAARSAGVDVVSAGHRIQHGQPVLGVDVLIDDEVTTRWINQHRGNVPVEITGRFQAVR